MSESRAVDAELEPIELEPLRLESFDLGELGCRLSELDPERRKAYAHAACEVGGFTCRLPAAWSDVIDSMIPGMERLAQRYLNSAGDLDPALALHNRGSTSPIDPVWLNDRTRPRDGAPYMPQRAIFVRLEKLADVYDDAELVLGFLLKELIRRQVICRSLELLDVPPELWRRATGGAVGRGWLHRAQAGQRSLDELAGQRRGADWRARVLSCWRDAVAASECWSWASVNYFLYNDGIDVARVPIRAIRDPNGRSGFAATLLIEHTDYDLVSTVVSDRGGLQGRDVDGSWREIEPGPLLVNTGKAMQLIAGGRYRDGEVVGGRMRPLPHRVVVTGWSHNEVKDRLIRLQRRISIVGVTEPHGERARLQTWDARARQLRLAAGLEHAAFWQFLIRQVPPAPTPLHTD